MTILGSKLVIAKSFVLQKLLHVAMVCQNLFYKPYNTNLNFARSIHFVDEYLYTQ